MNTQITFLRALRLLLLPHIDLMLIIHEVDDRGPRVAVVDVVAKTRGINDSELDFERLLLELGFDDVDLSFRAITS